MKVSGTFGNSRLNHLAWFSSRKSSVSLHILEVNWSCDPCITSGDVWTWEKCFFITLLYQDVWINSSGVCFCVSVIFERLFWHSQFLLHHVLLMLFQSLWKSMEIKQKVHCLPIFSQNFRVSMNIHIVSALQRRNRVRLIKTACSSALIRSSGGFSHFKVSFWPHLLEELQATVFTVSSEMRVDQSFSCGVFREEGGRCAGWRWCCCWCLTCWHVLWSYFSGDAIAGKAFIGAGATGPCCCMFLYSAFGGFIF